MFTVVLMNKSDSAPLQKVYAAENDYLTKEEKEDASSFPLLSEVSCVDICVFSSKEMPNLIKELENIKTSLSNDQSAHVDQIIELAKICGRNSEKVLGFTPFDTFLSEIELNAVQPVIGSNL